MKEKKKSQQSHFLTLLNNIQKVNKSLKSQQQSWQKVIYLLGNTKAGKTTLSYYLNGTPLTKFTNQQLGLELIDLVQPQVAKIGHQNQSQTVYPHIEENHNKPTIVDTPGFNETREEFKLVNLYIIRETLRKSKNVHFILVIPNEVSDELGKVESHINQLKEMFLPAHQKEVGQHLTICLTKTNEEDDKNNLIDCLQTLSQEKKKEKGISMGDFIGSTYQNGRFFQFCNEQPIKEDGIQLMNELSKSQFMCLQNIHIEELLNPIYGLQMQQKKFIKYLNEIVDEFEKEVELQTRIVVCAICMCVGQISQNDEHYDYYQKIFHLHMKERFKIDENQFTQDYAPIIQHEKITKLKEFFKSKYRESTTISSNTHTWGILIDWLKSLADGIMGCAEQLINTYVIPTLFIIKTISQLTEFIHLQIQKKKSQVQIKKIEKLKQTLKQMNKQIFTAKVIQFIQSEGNEIEQSQTSESLSQKEIKFNAYEDYNPCYELLQLTTDQEKPIQQYLGKTYQEIMNKPRNKSKLQFLTKWIFPRGIQYYIYEKQKNQQNERIDKGTFRQISFILEKHSQYQDSIWILLALNEYQALAQLLNEGYLIDNVFQDEFLQELGQQLQYNKRDNIAISIYNFMLSKCSTRQDAVKCQWLICSCIERNEARLKQYNTFTESRKSIINYDYIQKVDWDNIEKNVEEQSQRYQKIKNSLEPTYISIVQNHALISDKHIF